MACNLHPDTKQGDWADHLRGATVALTNRYPLRVGLCAIIDGELPIGGLSSSAAVIITFINALCNLNNIKLTEQELIQTALDAENNYVGVSCGKLDQNCEVYCKKDSLLYMDTKDDTYELIPQNPKMKPFKIALFFSGLERALTESIFNMRVDELRSAAYALMAYSGMEYGKSARHICAMFQEKFLMNINIVFPRVGEKRAEHWFTGV